jgi:gluconate 2-dehydrogenase gamma chain
MSETIEHLFFDEHEWNTIEAASARIFPTDHDPGASEANVVHFIDRYLSGIDYIYANPWGSGFLRLEGDRANAWTFRIGRLQQRYRDGIRELDAASKKTFGDDFVTLTEDQQDQVLASQSAAGTVPEPVSLKETTGKEKRGDGKLVLSMPVTDDALDFFGSLVLHTRMGFYADPAYGGNKDHVGWQVIGFPGPKSMAETIDGRFSTIKYLVPSDHVPVR